MVVQVNDVGMELKAEELRLGNYIRNMYGEVIKVDLKVLKQVTKGELFGVVQLNSDLLKKLGFTKSGTYWFKDNFIIWEWGINDVTYHSERITHNDDSRYNIIEFEYLHHLQNCFYFKTGKELNVKL